MIVLFVFIGAVFIVFSLQPFRSTAPGIFVEQDDRRSWKQHDAEQKDISNCSKATCFIHGRFQLQSVDAGFYDFLSDLGVPWFAISILKRMSETMDLLPPQNLTHGTWRWTIDRGVQPVLLNFRMGEPFQVALGSFLTLTRNCSLPSKSVIVCEDSNESGELLATSTNRFTLEGLTTAIFMESRNITAVKYYQRIVKS